VLQIHNAKMEHVRDPELWGTLRALRREGKVRAWGAAFGPAIGWLYEAVELCERENDIGTIQMIWNVLEQHPGSSMIEAASESARGCCFNIRVTHASGMLEGKYTEDTVFPANDHRRHRPRSWLTNGLKKLRSLDFLSTDMTLGQAALKWLLAEQRVVTTLPNIYDLDQLREGIYYRAWGQKDPLVEYKQEAYEMFVGLMHDLQTTFAERWLKLQIEIGPPRGGPAQSVTGPIGGHPKKQAPMVASKPAADGLVTSGNPPPPPRLGPAEHAFAANPYAGVGRNDPCPCGSGKKFKKCHGAAA